jgi:hypothetical protein
MSPEFPEITPPTVRVLALTVTWRRGDSCLWHRETLVAVAVAVPPVAHRRRASVATALPILAVTGTLWFIMSKTFEQGRDEIAALCDYFARNRAAFLAPGIKEAHVRQTLIDPFLEVLGWDVRNAAMAAPQYREVIPEDSIDVEGQQKAPDYTFRVGTLPKFYVEAKKCGVNINADPAPAEYQQGQLPCLPRRRCVCGPF